MSRLPRLLPLIGVAIGGVLAANMLQGARGVADLASPRPAAAEEAPAKPARAAKGAPKSETPPKTEAAQSPAAAPLPAGGAARPPVCAPGPADLAKAAGLSASELQIIQNLQARRGQIDAREKDLDTEIQLLGAAEAKVDAKLKAMNALKAELQGMMAAADQKSQKDIDNLVVVYSKMKPAEAAQVMSQLDDRVRLPIAAAMKAAVLSQILGKMGTLEAKALTERLAHRFAPLQAVADASKAPAPDPAGPPAAAAQPPAAKPAKRAKPAKNLARAAPKAKAPKADDESGDAPEVKTRTPPAAPPAPATKPS